MATLVTMQSRFWSFSSLYTKVFDGTIIDNTAFTLHYKVTCPLLLVFGLFVSGWHYVRSPITCTGDPVSKSMIEEYCWVHSTYTYKNGTNNQDKVYQDYYQWVRLFLVAQAVFFCLPRLLWKLLEGGKVRKIVAAFETNTNESSYNVHDKTVHLAGLLSDIFDRGHRFYGISFLVCEFLNLANVLFQLYFTNWFLDGRFFKSDNGTQLRDRISSESILSTGHFPTMTKCDFYQYGASSMIQLHSSLCVLPLNAVNSIIFSFLWYWFSLMAICSGLIVAHHSLWLIFPNLRWLDWKSTRVFRGLYSTRTSLVRMDIGNVLLLHFVYLNVPSVSFRSLVRNIEICHNDRDKKDDKETYMLT